jgi:NAD(P)H-hydrate epimerase
MTAPVVLTREQCRRVDALAIDEYGLPGMVLMENAGRGTAEKLLELGCRGPVLVCCGRGNNGGDGLVIARHLDLRGVAVRTLLFAPPEEYQGDAAINLRVVKRAGLPCEEVLDEEDLTRLDAAFNEAEWIVDALLGTGARGEPRGLLPTAIRRINASPAKTLAVDLPSGLDCDTGQPAADTIRAAHTCTFVALKPGFLVPGAEAFTGEVHVVEIGVPRSLLAEVQARC